MKLLSILTVVASVAAVAIPPSEQVPLQDGHEEFLIESAPGQRQWVTEDEKWQLRREGVNFLDITDERAAGIDTANFFEGGSPTYPDSLKHVDEVKALTSELSKKEMEDHLTQFTSFHTRYFKSKDGIKSATWLFEQIQDILDNSGASATGATVSRFNHPWGQFSIIARIPGRSDNTVVVGAHQDSINLFLPSLLAAPGADDDGSGTVTILEALRVFLKAPAIIQGNASNTVEFHWYSAEEGGLLGSQAVFKEYRKQEKSIKAMLQQDMTGYVQGTINAGQPESVGVITDYVDPGLTEFIKKVVTEYCDIPYVLTKCGYACSDHASASRYGYPSAFVIESAFEYSDKRIHTTEDKIEYISFDHMLQHAKMTLGFAYELGFSEM